MRSEMAQELALAVVIARPQIEAEIAKQAAKMEARAFAKKMAAESAAKSTGNVAYRQGTPVAPMEKTLDMSLNPELYANEVAKKYGINLKGSGQEITIKYNPDLPQAGLSRQATPNVIELGSSAYYSEGELANTIAHELNHARSWLQGGSAPEEFAYPAGNALQDYINGGR
jgi:hypothetical protein